MSSLNIQRIVNSLVKHSNVYTALTEAIVNSIHSIAEGKVEDGQITISVERSVKQQLPMDDDSLSEINAFYIEDNGIGFTDANRQSFDEFLTDRKAQLGGRGFGRFIYKKCFKEVNIESIYVQDSVYKKREFKFGDSEIIEDETVSESLEKKLKTVISLVGVNGKGLDKKIETISKRLIENLLIYFLSSDYKCPKIVIKEKGATGEIVLNDFIKKEQKISVIGKEDFELEKNNEKTSFTLMAVKIYEPLSIVNKICLTAHNRVVTEKASSVYIPEFDEVFSEKFKGTKGEKDVNFIIKSYVLGQYLDDRVLNERADFDFSENENLLSLSREEIEERAAKITKGFISEEMKNRRDRKMSQIKDYVKTSAPFYEPYLVDLDEDAIPYKLSEDKIEEVLHRAKFKSERQTSARVQEVLKSETTTDQKINEIINELSEHNASNLAKYVCYRKVILDVFEKCLEIDAEGKYTSEDKIHSVIYPTKKDSDSISYDQHNLWLIDERLSFSEYIASDLKISEENNDRPDLLVFNNKIAYREGDEASNPIIVFEFKKPNRDDFADPASKEDPIEQIIRYVNRIREKKYTTPKGRQMDVPDGTPMYGYIVCTLTPKVKKWLNDVKNFKPLPDGNGWFGHFGNINLYIEILSWDKVLKDSKSRNRIFFDKLGLD